MRNSRISGLQHLDIDTRLERLVDGDWLTAAEAMQLLQGHQVLRLAAADRMVENVIGVFGLPLAIAPNFVVNDRDYVVPMVVEEPSVVAALSNAARLARPAGFAADCDEWLLAGQVHVTAIANINEAVANLEARKAELLQQANEVHPRLAGYGGGVRDLECRELSLGEEKALAVHFLVDTGNAMGANIVNTICEAMAEDIAAICNGTVALRILSNLADRSLVRATVSYPVESLATGSIAGEEVRDRMIIASDIACADPYRAATHNKGIMNGIDAVAIATGNDWRALEAGAHGYAATGENYRPLARWQLGEDGALLGKLEIPLRVATVGGTLRANPAVALALRLVAAESSRELAQLMAAVGLAQNFAAVRALASDGIQEGHMRLHARSAGGQQRQQPDLHANPQGTAAGKVILAGEHAVVYGKHALALPIPGSVTAKVVTQDGGQSGLGFTEKLLELIRRELAITDASLGIEFRSTLPPGMGLGVSAAMAVAAIRAFDRHFGLALSDSAVNTLAFECEKIAHGNPSGIDNTIATYARPMLFLNAAGLQLQELELPDSPPLLVAFSSQSGSTLEQVAGVRARYEVQAEQYAAIFDNMDAISLAAAEALQAADYASLGMLMNTAHGLLNAIGVSTPELENMLAIARAAGATGAKLTGSGGGGSIVAVCPGTIGQVAAALAAAGFDTLSLEQEEDTC